MYQRYGGTLRIRFPPQKWLYILRTQEPAQNVKQVHEQPSIGSGSNPGVLGYFSEQIFD